MPSTLTFYLCDKEYAENANVPEKRKISVQVPNLVFVSNYISNQLYVAAYDTWEEEDTELFHAPTFNTYEETNICLGNLTTKKSPVDSCLVYIRRIQSAFFASLGTHDHFNPFLTYTSISNFWSLASTKKPNVITVDQLKPYKTLSTWLEKMKKV